MLLALFADIHGNSIALDAVLEDIRALGGVDEYWVLGDLAAVGHDPVGTLERLAALPNARFVRGNTDRYLITGELPKPWLANVAEDPALLPRLTEVAGGFGWTRGALVAGRWIDWLARMPVEERATLPDGTRLLAVHASVAGKDDGRSISPRTDEATLTELMAGAEADLAFVGHAHWPLDTRVNALRVVNVGSVSNSFRQDLRASYVLVEADASGYTLELRRVDYDREAVITEIRRAHHPAEDFLIGYMRGLHVAHWGEPAED